MKAVVLAAGEGTRMRPLTRTRPKPLLPVGEKTILEKVLDACYEHVEAFVIVVGYRGDDIKDAVGNTYRGKPIDYAEQEVETRFVVVNGDVLISSDLVRRLTSASENACAVKRVDDPTSYGVANVDDGYLTGIVEKPEDPPSNLANLGTYVFENEVF
ncbi:MAG: sugar phosphate nucleotidyltransferase, partial [Halobacteria archaeon]|nr:sugar phosphate nucleotidyltransferase [Halobacteria archaeon]